MGMAQCHHEVDGVRCGLAPNHEGDCKPSWKQCQARHGQKVSLQCQAMLEEEEACSVHWAIDEDGATVRWNDLAAMYPVFETKDSGVRAEYDSGMVRDTDSGKGRFELLLPLGVPYEAQFLTRVAQLMARGAEKYDTRNWEKAAGDEELERFKSSAIRHLMQWAAGETDEDHAAAVVFNLLGYETTRWKRDHG